MTRPEHSTALMGEAMPWAVDAACRRVNPEVMFPPEDDRAAVAAAKAVCAGCPVLTDCLDHALRAREAAGVWGGTTAQQRRGILRRARAADPRPARPRRPDAPTCTEDDCAQPVDARGLCGRHYKRRRREGTLP